MQAEATVHEGAVIIPPIIRETLHLRDGDTLVFDSDANGIRLRVQQRGSFHAVVGIFGDASEGKSIEQIVAEEREQRGY